MARGEGIENVNNVIQYASEEDFRAANFSTEIRAPQINKSIRDRSCIVNFPRGVSENRLTRAHVEELMTEQWGDLFSHVIQFGTVDFAKKWIFSFESEFYNNQAVRKEIFINGKRVKVFHATKQFNELKVDYIPMWTCLDDLAKIIQEVDGVTGEYVDCRWARGDKVNKDSTQAILRFYVDSEKEFNPQPYIHFFDEYGQRVFLHLTVMGNTPKCMKCNDEGHFAGKCPYFFCHACGLMQEKLKHTNCTLKKDKRAGNYKISDRKEAENPPETPEAILNTENDKNDEEIPPIENNASLNYIKDTPQIKTKGTKLSNDIYIGKMDILDKGGKKRKNISTNSPPLNEEKKLKANKSYSEAITNKTHLTSSSPKKGESAPWTQENSKSLSPIQKNTLNAKDYPSLNESLDLELRKVLNDDENEWLFSSNVSNFTYNDGKVIESSSQLSDSECTKGFKQIINSEKNSAEKWM